MTARLLGVNGVEVVRPGSDDCHREVWQFLLMFGNVLQLVRYSEEWRPSARHKWESRGRWLYDGPTHGLLAIATKNVVLPERVARLAFETFVSGFRVRSAIAKNAAIGATLGTTLYLPERVFAEMTEGFGPE